MKETEVKFQIENLELIENKIEETGARYHGESFQHDIWFDNPALKLKDNGAGVRLRMENKTLTVTLKHKLVIDKNFREAEEIEFGVDNFNKAKAFLEGLGFKEDYQLKKKRKTWKMGNLELALDTIQELGIFLEMEGTEDAIEKAIKRLEMK